MKPRSKTRSLFNTLAREEALAEMFRDPGLRAELLASLDEAPRRWYEGWLAGWRPAAAALTFSALILAGVFILRQQPEKGAAEILADARRPARVEQRAAASAAVPPSAAPPAAATPARRRVEPPVHELRDEAATDKKVRANAAEANEVKGEASAVKEKDAGNALAKTDLPAAAPKPAAEPVITGRAEAAPPPRLAAQHVEAATDALQQAQNARALFYAGSLMTQGYVQGGQQGAPGGQQGAATMPRQDVQQQKAEPASQTEQKQQQQVPLQNRQVVRSMAGLTSNAPSAVPFAGVRYKIVRQIPMERSKRRTRTASRPETW